VPGLSTDLLVLADTAMHGTTDAVQLEGAERDERAIVVSTSDRFALHWDKAATPDELTARCLADVKLPAGLIVIAHVTATDRILVEVEMPSLNVTATDGQIRVVPAPLIGREFDTGR